MSHSNSSLNCFASCMARYEHSYILHTPPCKPVSPHLTFGVMAHEVLEKAGRLRDDSGDGVVSVGEYQTIIPSELLYPELKQEFQIKSWDKYFTNVIKQVAKYESELLEEIYGYEEDAEILREVKLQITPEELRTMGHYGISQPLVGVIDLLIKTEHYAFILDYKFSSNKKSQDDFDMNSQLPIYAYLIHVNYGIPIRNIKYGYIDIPKQDFGTPTLLTNGTLSRAKSQNVSQELYEKAVIAIHGEDDPKYNCKPGGYYYDAWCEFALNKPAYLSIQWLDIGVVNGVIPDIMNAAKICDLFRNNDRPFLRKYESYSCKSCEYVEACKPWLTVGGA